MCVNFLYPDITSPLTAKVNPWALPQYNHDVAFVAWLRIFCRIVYLVAAVARSSRRHGSLTQLAPRPPQPVKDPPSRLEFSRFVDFRRFQDLLTGCCLIQSPNIGRPIPMLTWLCPLFPQHACLQSYQWTLGIQRILPRRPPSNVRIRMVLDSCIKYFFGLRWPKKQSFPI